MQTDQEWQVEVKKIDDGFIVKPVGFLDRSRTPEFRVKIEEIQRSHPDRLIIDLCEVPSIDSSVLALLVSTLRVTRSGSGMLVICGLNKMVESVFEIARLRDGMFTITNTLLEATKLPNRRAGERFTPDGISCNLGKVCDISLSGMRIVTSSALAINDELKSKLKSPDGEVNLDVRVVWAYKIRFRRHEAGLHFIRIPQGTLDTFQKIVSGSEH